MSAVSMTSSRAVSPMFFNRPGRDHCHPVSGCQVPVHDTDPTAMGHSSLVTTVSHTDCILLLLKSAWEGWYSTRAHSVMSLSGSRKFSLRAGSSSSPASVGKPYITSVPPAASGDEYAGPPIKDEC